jgi:hypothetical protein
LRGPRGAPPPTQVRQQAEVFAEFQAKTLGGGELALIERQADVAQAAEVGADQFIDCPPLAGFDDGGICRA